MHKKVMLLQDINLFKNNSIELEDEVIIMIAESFKALVYPTRLRILVLLFPGERSVGNLANHLEVSQSAVSHLLRILRSLVIVRYRKDRREVFILWQMITYGRFSYILLNISYMNEVLID